MKTLVVFYSRTGTTKKVAEAIGKNLNCDIEELIDTKNRMGFFDWLRSSRDAMRKKLTIIKEIRYRPSDYDIVIIGTPIWFEMPAPAIRTYISSHKDSFKKVAFFCTCTSSGMDKTFAELEKLCGKAPIALLDVNAKEIKNDSFSDKAKQFTGEIK